jgi:hypothetical protein
MCDRRYCGCVLRGRNLMLLTVVVVAAVTLAGATAIQDLIDGILIALSVLTIGLLAIFALQVCIHRRRAARAARAVRAVSAVYAERAVRAVRPVPAAVAAAPRPAPSVPAQARPAADGSQWVLPDGESAGQAALGAIRVQL